MTESIIQTLFSKVIETDRNAAYELKIEKGKSMPFNKVAEHQLEALKRVKTTGLFYKLTDMPHFAGMKARFDRKKGFDCLTIKGKAYIGICFYEPRKPKEVILIDVDKFIEVRQILADMDKPRKSLTKDMAVEISERVIKLSTVRLLY
jgi:hypothetical protein